jgi:FAD/FMN-containing dehydrogenase
MTTTGQPSTLPTLNGRFIRPGDADYDRARALYNGMIDKRPALIARCADVSDIVPALALARERGLPLAIRGGGHNGPGLGSCNDGLVIDLSELKAVDVDPLRRRVRVSPGCTSGDVDNATHPFGLAVPFGLVSTTGVAGLTLGGGTGYLTRQYGLTIDNLVEVDVVLADGRHVTASAEQHPELFWASRGGGGNFGVVSSFVFAAHPVTTVFGGPVFYDLSDARTVMRVYREFLPAAPHALYPFVGLKTVPSADPFPLEFRGRRVCALISCFNGAGVDGVRALAPLVDALPAPLFDWRSEMPFPVLQSLFDALLPSGLQWYWKGDFVKTLSDEAIDAHIACAAAAPTELSLMHLYPIDGAVHRVAADATAWRARDATWSMVIAGVGHDPAQADRLRAWARDYWRRVHPFNLDGGYVNFMMDDEGEARTRATYGANYERLAAVKAIYDPTNLFRVNQNIEPAHGRSDSVLPARHA